MMTRKRAERIVAAEVHVGQMGNGGPWECWISTPEIFGTGLYGFGKTEHEALGNVAETFYKKECLRVFESQGWKCCSCGELRPLQGHHKVHRSHGRVDRDNIEGRCAKCHGQEHGG